MSSEFWLLNGSTPVRKRAGIVRSNRKVVLDDTGVFHPRGLTLFWALYGWKFERSRIVAHLDWIYRTYGPDYVRILCEVDWTGRSIVPVSGLDNSNNPIEAWPDYVQVLQEFVDFAYDRYGIRSQLTLVGGRRAKHLDIVEIVTGAMKGREHKVMLYEMVNEWHRLNKANLSQLIAMGIYTRARVPNLVALSTPQPKVGESHGGHHEMIFATQEAGCNAYVPHTRRSDMDLYWDPVSQGYDFRVFPGATFNNEPQGLQSSVDAYTEPIHMVADRVNGVFCGAAGYCLHVAQGVTGVEDTNPSHPRPQNMWDVPRVEETMARVRASDDFLIEGVENWAVRNNFRDDHPFPVGKGDFWPEGHEEQGIYKNYAAVNGSQFGLVITGVRSVVDGLSIFCGQSLWSANVVITDLSTGRTGAPQYVDQDSDLFLAGREDSLTAYVVRRVP